MERGFLLDEEGHLFRCLDLNDGMKSLPVVETFQMTEPIEGAKVESEGVLAGLKLILESEKRFVDEGMAVRAVRVRDEWAVECDYTNDLLVTFGVYDFARGLDDLDLILDRMAESGRVLASVNVAAARNIPVTFATATSAEGDRPAAAAGEDAAADSVLPPSPDESREAMNLNDQEKHLRSILRGG
jgi:hypothetical protein